MNRDLKSIEKEQAQRALDRIEAQDKFSSDQVASMGKWLMASLLAANSGGIIVTAQSASGPDSWAAALFILGAGASLLTGVAMQEFYNHSPEMLRFKERYWLHIQAGEPRSRRKERLIEIRMRRAMRKAIVVPLLDWLSGLLWLCGVVRLVATS